ncbi:hypothetical protein Tco_1486271, partial [Tanacetum coccineum]
MISEEMKHTKHYRMYAEVFGIDVPLTQSQPTESTQGMHRTPSVPRRSIRLTPPAPVPTIDKADEIILQDTLQMVEGPENVIDDSSIPMNDDRNIPRTRLEPRSDKESPEVEITNDEEEEREDCRSPRIHTDLVSLDTEKLQELTVTDTTPTPSSSSPNTKLSTTNQLLSLFKAKPARFKCYKSFFQELQGCYGYLFKHLKARFLSRKSFDTLAGHLQEVMDESLPTMVDKHIKEQVENSTTNNICSRTTISTVPQTTYRTPAVRPRDQDDPHDDAHPVGENSAKRQKTSEYEAYVSGGPLSGHVFQEKQAPSTSGNQDQDDDFDFWTDSYASDDDEILTKQVSQDIMEEVSLTID